MRQSGFTLVELLTVIAIMGILLAVGTLAFGTMQKNAGMEAQVRMLQADLLELRQQALYRKRPRSVVISGQSFNIYSSATVTASPQRSKTLNYPMLWSSGGTLTFDSQGLTGVGGTERFLCIAPNGSLSQLTSAAVDSLVISDAQINVGIRTGGTCNSDNIDKK